MVSRKDSNAARMARHKRVRAKISGTPDIPRLCVYRSLANIRAQIIDDVNGVRGQRRKQRSSQDSRQDDCRESYG